MKKGIPYSLATALMKISIIPVLLLIFTLCAYAENSAGQDAQNLFRSKINVNLVDQDLKNSVNLISREANIKFIFSPELVKASRKITLKGNHLKLTEILDRLAKTFDLNYALVDNYIVLTPKKGAAESPVADEAKIPNEIVVKSVSGTVTDDKGVSLPGVTILEKGTTNAVSTDANGRFRISVKDESSVLIVSYIGFTAKEVAVGASADLSISLTPESKGLNEVIVIGYGTTTRQNITTAVTKIDPKVVPQAANNSVEELLFGRGPGLNVQQSSSQPGGLINLSIRGRGTPLIVVDGVVFPNSSLEAGPGSISFGFDGVNRGALAGINPDDVESVEVLKDASAAIYGINAANGVILITTKKGKAGKINVNFNGNHSVINNTKYLTPLTATEYETYYNTVIRDKYLAGKSMYPYGTVTPGGLPAPTYSDAQIAAAGTGTNWVDQIFNTGYVDNDNLDISGGTEKMTYYFSGGYFNQKGTIANSALTKYTGRANMTFNLTKWFSLSGNFTGSSNQFLNSTSGGETNNGGSANYGILQAALNYPANVPLYKADGTLSQFTNTPNPLGLAQISDHTYYHSLSSNFSADFKLTPNGLGAHLLFGDNYESSTRDFFVPSTIYYNSKNLSLASLNFITRENTTYEATITYKKALTHWMDVDAVGGIGQYIQTANAFGSQGSGAVDGLGTSNLSAETGNLGITSYQARTTQRSYFARANFTFLNRYLLNASVRDDGYSLFFPDHKYAIFPSASVGWKINEENFLRNSNLVSQLKLRASVGITGQNQGAAGYGGYRPNNDNIYFNNSGVSYVTIVRYALDNPDLSWQKTTNKNIGIDFGFWKDRISGSIDWFKDDITNLISSSAPTAPLSQFSSQTVNGGHQYRTGLDFTITSHNISTKAFDWTTTVNLSHYEYKWQTRFPFTVLANYQDATDPVNELYYFQTDGLIQPGQTVPASQPKGGGASLPGSPLFVDQNGDGKLDYLDVKKLNPDPKLNIGFGNTFHYKQIDLSIFFYGQFGGNATNYNYGWADPVALASGQQAGTTGLSEVFSSANLSGNRPSVNYTEASAGLLVGSDINRASTNFVRCRNLTLGYTFNNKFFTKFSKSFRLFVDAQNLFTITNYKGADPETSFFGVKGAFAPYPPTRTISFGLHAGF